ELAKSCTKRITECGNSDVKTEGWVPDPEDPGREMCIYTYEKPLGFSIGPKSTTVEDTFRIVVRDFDKAILVEQVVRTPNVPSGTAFFVKIRHCLTWTAGPSNQPPGGWSRYQMTFEVEWTKSSWIKNAIEKGSADSNKQAGELLEKYIREWIAAHPSLEVKAQAHSIVPKSIGASSSHKSRRKGAGAPRKSRREESPRGLRMEELIGDSERARARTRRASDSKGRASGVEADGGRAEASASADAMKSAQAAAARAGDAVAAAATAAKEAREAEVWKQRARDSWIGWIGCHSVYPVVRGSRRAGRSVSALLANPVAGPLVVCTLLLLLVLTNTWRFASVARSPSAGTLLPASDAGGAAVGGAGAGNGGVVGAGILSRLGGVFGFSSRVHVEGIEEMRRSVDALTAQMAVINKQLERLVEQQQQQQYS
ncbi:hypothetical protein LPJ56_003929, partial [Coemansia sp. RSA 2599]